MYGLPKKNFSSLIIPVLILICFAFLIAEPAYAAKAPAKAATAKAAVEKKAPVKADADNTATTEPASKDKEDEMSFDEDKQDAPIQTPASEPEAPANPFDEIVGKVSGATGLDKNIAGIVTIAVPIVVLVLIVVLIASLCGKKNKCQKCGTRIPAGETLCGLCSSQAVLTDMEANAGQIQPQQNIAVSAPPQQLPQSGQLPTSAFQQSEQQSFASQYASQLSAAPAPAVPAAAPADKKKSKQRPTGRVTANLNMRKGPNPGYRFSLYDSQTQITIGRDEDCDFVIEDEEDKEIASRHATITIEGQMFTVHDISAAAGIQVNGQRVQQAQLKTGDVIKLGRTELAFARL